MCKFGPFCFGRGTNSPILRTAEQVFSTVYATAIKSDTQTF